MLVFKEPAIKKESWIARALDRGRRFTDDFPVGSQCWRVDARQAPEHVTRPLNPEL